MAIKGVIKLGEEGEQLDRDAFGSNTITALQLLSKGRLSKKTIVQGTFIQGTVVQGHSCPRRRLLSKETVVQGNYCPRRQLHYLLSKEEG